MVGFPRVDFLTDLAWALELGRATYREAPCSHGPSSLKSLFSKVVRGSVSMHRGNVEWVGSLIYLVVFA